MTSAAVLKIDSCPLEGLDTNKYDQILKLAGTGYKTVCACALGYRAATDSTQHAKKARFLKSEVIQTV
jgi:nitroreductase